MSRLVNPQIVQSVSRVRAAVRRALAPEPYAVGGPCGQRPATGPCNPPSIDKMCFKGGKRLCDLQKVSNSVVQVGGAVWTLPIEPVLSAYFEPLAVRMVVTDANNSNLNYRTFVTSVSINQFPQEAINQPAPNLGTTQGYWSDDYQDPDHYAIPVGWGVFGKVSLGQNLTLIGIHRGYPPGVTLFTTVTLYGNAFDQLPHGCMCGHPVPEKPSGCNGNGNGNGGGNGHGPGTGYVPGNGNRPGTAVPYTPPVVPQ